MNFLLLLFIIFFFFFLSIKINNHKSYHKYYQLSLPPTKYCPQCLRIKRECRRNYLNQRLMKRKTCNILEQGKKNIFIENKNGKERKEKQNT